MEIEHHFGQTSKNVQTLKLPSRDKYFTIIVIVIIFYRTLTFLRLRIEFVLHLLVCSRQPFTYILSDKYFQLMKVVKTHK